MYIRERSKPSSKAAETGRLGTASGCLPGDLVVVEMVPGRFWPAQIAWFASDGFAFVCAYSTKTGQAGLRSEHIFVVSPEARVKWIKVISK
jgi:hypothetical protein